MGARGCFHRSIQAQCAEMGAGPLARGGQSGGICNTLASLSWGGNQAFFFQQATLCHLSKFQLALKELAVLV